MPRLLTFERPAPAAGVSNETSAARVGRRGRCGGHRCLSQEVTPELWEILTGTLGDFGTSQSKELFGEANEL